MPAAAFTSGIDLSRQFYAEAVRPLVAAVPHSAALLGRGSEVLGLDDEMSGDHGWEPRSCSSYGTMRMR